MSTVREEWEMACPKCAKDDEIYITATIAIVLTPHGANETGGQEWDGKSEAWCLSCSYAGTVEDFKVKP